MTSMALHRSSQVFDPNSFSQAFRNGQGFGGFKDFSSGFGPDVGGGSSFFESLFGALNNGPGSRQRSRGEDLEVSVGVSFMESCKGTKRSVKISPVVDCLTCSGLGLKPGAKRTTCTACSGSGTRTFVIDSGFQMASTCPSCSGVEVRYPGVVSAVLVEAWAKSEHLRPLKSILPPGTSHVDKLFMLLCRYLLVRRRGRNDYPRSESGRCSSNWKGGRPVTCLCGSALPHPSNLHDKEPTSSMRSK